MTAAGIFTNPKQLTALVQEGQGQALELERSMGELKEGMQTLCAFLNGSGFPTEMAGTKSGPSWDQVGTKSAPSRDQVAVLESCRVERTLLELVKVVGRADRTKFSDGVVKLETSIRHGDPGPLHLLRPDPQIENNRRKE